MITDNLDTFVEVTGNWQASTSGNGQTENIKALNRHEHNFEESCICDLCGQASFDFEQCEKLLSTKNLPRYHK